MSIVATCPQFFPSSVRSGIHQHRGYGRGLALKTEQRTGSNEAVARAEMQ